MFGLLMQECRPISPFSSIHHYYCTTVRVTKTYSTLRAPGKSQHLWVIPSRKWRIYFQLFDDFIHLLSVLLDSMHLFYILAVLQLITSVIYHVPLLHSLLCSIAVSQCIPTASHSVLPYSLSCGELKSGSAIPSKSTTHLNHD